MTRTIVSEAILRSSGIKTLVLSLLWAILCMYVQLKKLMFLKWPIGISVVV